MIHYRKRNDYGHKNGYEMPFKLYIRLYGVLANQPKGKSLKNKLNEKKTQNKIHNENFKEATFLLSLTLIIFRIIIISY